MPYETKPNTGTLFVNDRKQQENQPDYTGKILLSADLIKEIQQYSDPQIEIAAWVKGTKNGGTILSLTCKPAYRKDQPSKPNPTAYLSKLKKRLEEAQSIDQLNQVVTNISQPQIWEVFESDPAIAATANEMIAARGAVLEALELGEF